MTKALRIRHGSFGRVAVLEMDRRLVVHAHPHAHLLFKVAGADGWFGLHDRRLPLGAEWAVAVNPWEPHWYPRASGSAPSLILALHLDHSWLAARLDGFRGPRCFPCHAVRVSPRLRTLVSTLNAEMFYGEGEDRAFVEELLVTLADRMRQAPVATSERKSECFARVDPIDRRIRRSIEFMQSRISERLGLETLARSVGLSRQHFFDLFRRSTTLTPSVFWNMLRMEQAVGELGSGPRPIHDIAADLGFSAQSNFARFFRDHLGSEPARVPQRGGHRGRADSTGRGAGPGPRRTSEPRRRVLTGSGRASDMSAHHREWVPGDGFREWAYRRLVEAEIEKVESKVRYTIDDVIRFGRPHFANALEARLAVAIAGVVTRYICEPVPAGDFDAFVAGRIERNHRAPHNRIGALLVPRQCLGEAATDLLVVALFDDVKERRDVVEKIAIHCIAQGREVRKPDPEEAARRKADMESLERQGCKVFRFVESDILSDALDCARAVNRYLSRLENNYARTYNYRAAVGAAGASS